MTTLSSVRRVVVRLRIIIKSYLFGKENNDKQLIVYLFINVRGK